MDIGTDLMTDIDLKEPSLGKADGGRPGGDFGQQIFSKRSVAPLIIERVYQILQKPRIAYVAKRDIITRQVPDKHRVA